MQPAKANHIFRKVNQKVPGRHSRRNPFLFKVSVIELTPGGLEFEHTGFGRPSRIPSDEGPGSLIGIKILTRPTLRERFSRDMLSPDKTVTQVLGALAELGYLKPEDGAAAPVGSDDLPQLELLNDPDTVPHSSYDNNLGRVVTLLTFQDHNPMR